VSSESEQEITFALVALRRITMQSRMVRLCLTSQFQVRLYRGFRERRIHHLAKVATHVYFSICVCTILWR